MTLLKYAQYYRDELGFSVIPLRSRDKIPAIKWQEFQKRYATDEELSRWFTTNDYNIGVVTGKISGITVVDFDTKDAMRKHLSFLKTSPLVKTGKGCHAYCTYTPEARQFQHSSKYPGIDVRNDGGYVVAPPSIHSSGEEYKWLKKPQGNQWGEYPSFLLTPGVARLQTTDEINSLNAELMDKPQQGPVAEGGRNNALTSYVGRMFNKNLAIDEISTLAHEWNQKRCKPPLPDDEVEAVIKSIAKYHLDKQTDKPARELVLVNGNEMIARDIPRREPIFPWLLQQALVMLYAWRGVGKTWVSLGIAVAIATGGRFLKWHASKPHKVVYLDGEMPAYALQERLKVLAPSGLVNPDNLKFLTPDFQSDGMPDLATLAGQAEIDALIEADTTLIIVDNISALCRSGKENEAEGWIPVQMWALRHRAAGRSVLFVHHAGKGGNQRGSSKREDLLDTVLMLKHPGGYTADKGALFEVHFEKSRHLAGQETIPFVAELQDGIWKVVDIENGTFEKIVELANLGMKQSDIANELGIAKSTVHRNWKKASEAGLISSGTDQKKIPRSTPREWNGGTNATTPNC